MTQVQRDARNLPLSEICSLTDCPLHHAASFRDCFVSWLDSKIAEGIIFVTWYAAWVVFQG